MTATSANSEAAVYSGSLAELAGGVVLAADDCTCPTCRRYFREGRDSEVRAEAFIRDPRDGRRVRIEHARWSSVS